ncbi:MAG TPA: glycosyltransferase [Candidatus Limnocylindria bacterium]
MRVLYVTEGFPYPLTSGNLRHYHLIRGLSESHEVHLASIVGGDHRVEHADAMRPFCASVETFRSAARSSLWRKASTRARELVVGGGTNAAARALTAAVAEPLSRSAYDVIVLHGRLTVSVLDHAGHTPVVVDLCDAPMPRLLSQLRYSSVLRRLQIRLRMRRVRRAEDRLIGAGSHLLFASARDRDLALRDVTATPPATVLPNGVDLEYWHRTQPRLGDEVVFSGAMHYPPNDDAARFLVGSVMPVVWNAEPTVRVRVIGLSPSAALRRAAARDARVEVTGFVDDVRPHLERGAVYAAPLRFASGIQNKLLEALAMELPVVTTRHGADGLRGDDDPELPLVVASGADDFAAGILAALDRAERDPEPHRAGRAFVSDRFTWPQANAILERVLADVGRSA